MPLHSKDDARDDLLEDIYASADLSVAMPKYKMPEHEHDPRHAFSDEPDHAGRRLRRCP